MKMFKKSDSLDFFLLTGWSRRTGPDQSWWEPLQEAGDGRGTKQHSWALQARGIRGSNHWGPLGVYG